MAHITITGHVAHIEGPGALYVCSDLHGNLEDFHRVVERFESEDDSALLFLGDLFHGPDATAEQWPHRYAFLGDHYDDHSAELFRAISALMRRHPRRVTSLLGNHDHAHVGGPRVSKFHTDEASVTEAALTTTEVAALRDMLRKLPLIAVTPCGAAFTHACPPRHALSVQALDDIDLTRYRDVPMLTMSDHDFLGELLWRRYATEDETADFLSSLAAITGQRCHFVCHGHEIVREGYEATHPNMINLSTSFGMERAFKTCLRLDLSHHYANTGALRPGHELIWLYGDA